MRKKVPVPFVAFFEYHCDRHVSLRKGKADASGIMLSLHVREAATAAKEGSTIDTSPRSLKTICHRMRFETYSPSSPQSLRQEFPKISVRRLHLNGRGL